MKLDGFMWLTAQNRTSIENGKNLCHQHKPREEECPERNLTRMTKPPIETHARNLLITAD